MRPPDAPPPAEGIDGRTEQEVTEGIGRTKSNKRALACERIPCEIGWAARRGAKDGITVRYLRSREAVLGGIR